jgi:hypothetical protein
MEKFLAHTSFAWIGCLLAEATGLLGLASVIARKDVLGVKAENWFSLCSLYMMLIMMVLIARMVLNQERGAD